MVKKTFCSNTYDTKTYIYIFAPQGRATWLTLLHRPLPICLQSSQSLPCLHPPFLFRVLGGGSSEQKLVVVDSLVELLVVLPELVSLSALSGSSLPGASLSGAEPPEET